MKRGGYLLAIIASLGCSIYAVNYGSNFSGNVSYTINNFVSWFGVIRLYKTKLERDAILAISATIILLSLITCTQMWYAKSFFQSSSPLTLWYDMVSAIAALLVAIGTSVLANNLLNNDKSEKSDRFST